MERIKATYKESTYNADGTANIVFVVSSPDCKRIRQTVEKAEKSRETGDIAVKTALELKLSKWREKRSNDANSYCWQLLEKIAEAMSVNGQVFTATDIYRETIRQCGVWRDVKISNDATNTLRYSWGLQGIGYLSEMVEKGETFSTVRLYYGSSRYNSKQMSRLIDYIVYDAKELGIETATPNEIAELKSLWGVQAV